MRLKPIANAMRTGLDWSRQLGVKSAWNMRSLPKGLQMLLSYEGDRWRLALRREGVPPSEEEIALCSEAFEVPEGAARANRTQKEHKPATGRTATYHVVELTWLEYETAPVA